MLFGGRGGGITGVCSRRGDGGGGSGHPRQGSRKRRSAGELRALRPWDGSASSMPQSQSPEGASWGYRHKETEMFLNLPACPGRGWFSPSWLWLCEDGWSTFVSCEVAVLLRDLRNSSAWWPLYPNLSFPGLLINASGSSRIKCISVNSVGGALVNAIKPNSTCFQRVS